MRLLNVHTLRPSEFYGESLPEYAILSHTWGDDEVNFQEVALEFPTPSKAGYIKLKGCAEQAKKDELDWIWMDTCCIDKSSSAELSETINSLYHWYKGARACYTYLSDVSISDTRSEENQWVTVPSTPAQADSALGINEPGFQAAFHKSRWFTRGWTLQELIAPPSVLFFTREWHLLGSKVSLKNEIHTITGIQQAVLQGRSPLEYTIEERMAWAENRNTTRIEDAAYSLLGLFDIHMPLLYGEGDRAFDRLAEEIVKTTVGYKLRPNARHRQRGSDTKNGLGIGGKLAPYLIRTAEVSDAGDGKDRKIPALKQSNDSSLHGAESSSPVKLRNGDQDSQPEDSRIGPEPNLRSPGTVTRLISSQLRILTLDPGVIGDRLSGTVREYAFSNAPPYYALSYTWGQEPDTYPIFLNGRKKLIRSSLFQALQRVRLRSGKVDIWVDSLCINQDDELERNSQVRQMAEIYQNASGVMIWLGEADSTSRLAMDLITKIVQSSYSWRGPWWEDFGFVALAQVLERPWFRRRWVLQEAAMSSNSTIYCGDRQVYMNTFAMAVNLIRARLGTATPPDVQNDQTSHIAFLANFRDSPAVRLLDTIEKAFRRSDEGSIVHRRLSLEILVDLARFSDTTDHRDTIYSLLSLARDATMLTNSLRSDVMLDPDYSKTVLDVYSDFISHCAHHSGSLDILCRPWAPVPSSHHNFLNIKKIDQSGTRVLPSWISTRDHLPFGDPSLRLTQRLHGNSFVGSSQKRAYKCHHRSEPELRLGRTPQNQCNGSLFVKGFVLGTIAKRSMRMANALITKECLQLLASAIQISFSRPFSVPDVMWRTICADRDYQGEPAPPVYRSAMTHLLQLSCETSISSESSNLIDSISSIDVEELLDTDLNDHVRTFLEIVRDVIWNRRTFQTHPEVGIDGVKRPFVGLVPQAAKVGDVMCILYGCSVPVVLRRKLEADGTDCWQLIGDAYVDGIMDGELIEFAPPSRIKDSEVEFELR